MKTKCKYEQPSMRVVELRGRQRILAGSDGNGGSMPGGQPAEPF